MNAFETPAIRATVGAGLLLICGLVGRGVMPERDAAAPPPVFDPSGSDIVVATGGNETVTIYGVELSGIGGLWSGLLDASGSDVGLATDSRDGVSRSGRIASLAPNAVAERFFPPEGLTPDGDTTGTSIGGYLPHLPAMAGLPSGMDRRSVQPLIEALIDPGSRQEPSSLSDPLPADLPSASSPIVTAAAPWTVPADTLDSTARPVRESLPVAAAGGDPISRTETPHKRSGDGRPSGNGAGSPFAEPAAHPAATPVAKSPVVGLPGRRTGTPGIAGASPGRERSPFDWGGPVGHGSGPGAALDDPLGQLFDGPDPAGANPPAPADWTQPFAPSANLPVSVAPEAVPEPGTLLLIALALLALGLATTRRPMRASKAPADPAGAPSSGTAG